MAEGSTVEMPDKHRELLRTNMLYLSKQLVCSADLYNHLEHRHVLTERMHDNIKSKSQGDRQKEIRELVNTICRRGDTALYWFLVALRESHQVHIADHIQQQQEGPLLQAVGGQNPVYPAQIKKPVRESGEEAARLKYPVREQVGEHALEKKLDLDERETVVLKYGERVENGEPLDDAYGPSKGEYDTNLDLHTLRDDQETERHKMAPSREDRSQEISDVLKLHEPPFSIDAAEPYDISSSPRGLMLLIDIRNFDDPSQNRNGTDLDVTRVKATFKGLGFEVIVKYDLTKEMFTSTVGAFLRDRRHTERSSLAMVVMSHGRNGCIITKDMQEMSIETILRQFARDRYAKNFAGKPKFFLFHICRVKDDSGKSGQVVTENANAAMNSINGNQSTAPPPAIETSHVSPVQESDAPGKLDKSTKKVVESASGPDMVIVYPTLSGMSANRYVTSPVPGQAGSWLINVLCDVFDRYGPHSVADATKRYHLHELLVHVSRKMLENYGPPVTHGPEAAEKGVEMSLAASGTPSGTPSTPNSNTTKPQVVEVISTLNRQWYFNPPPRETQN